jgi:sugar phosphate isomerase/epimerase
VPPRPAGGIPLEELPARVAEFGIGTMEICHFHLPSRDSAYLARLRGALEQAGVELWNLLIDAGDISSPETSERDLAWIEGWIDVAGELGAKNARVIAGKQEPSPAALDQSRQGMDRLAQRAEARGVRLLTENWLGLMSSPQIVLDLLDSLDGRVGLLLDFGNWKGPHKYRDLEQIFPRAESCHAKCHFSAPRQPDRDDFVRCLNLSRAAGFRGPYTLIYDGPDNDEWLNLGVEREMVRPYLNGGAN